jgi:hypothetical protein
MNTQDRELFQNLYRRQLMLEASVAALRTDLDFFSRRIAQAEATAAVPPPLPVPEPAPVLPPPLPPEFTSPVTELTAEPVPEPVPVLEPAMPELPPTPPPFVPHEAHVNFEFQFGRWLARIGVVMLVLFLITFSTYAYEKLHDYIGPWTKLTFLTLVSGGFVAGGLRLERKSPGMTVYARTLAAGGLAGLYYTLYGATYVQPLHVNPSPTFGGLLLLAWSAGVLFLAEKKKSELLSIFAIALAYFSSVITPVGEFTMVANLILALTAVVFLVRNSWTGLSYLCLIGTYAGYLRQIFALDPTMGFPYDIVSVHPSFWPSSFYLAGAWIIFTTGIFLARSPSFAEERRLGFLCLNNGAVVGLLLTASHLSGYGHNGTILGIVGVACLACFFLARVFRNDAKDIADAYLMQGLGLATAGIAVAYKGMTRGLAITFESVFLAAAGAYTRNRIARIAALLSAILASACLAYEIGFHDQTRWMLTLCGAVAMLANAWFARYDFRNTPREVSARQFVLTSAFYDLLALAVLFTGIVMQTSDDWVAPHLAIAALVLTLGVYLVPLFELPPLSQGLLVMAQLIGIGVSVISASPSKAEINVFPGEPQWGQNIVTLMTMALAIWWPRQKRINTRYWLTPLLLFYALAMAGYCFTTIYPHVSPQGWMMSAAALSLAFLAFGALARSWQFALAGQILLGISVATYLNLDGTTPGFPWTWWAAAVVPATVYLTARIARWLLTRLGANDSVGEVIGYAARLYQSVALALTERWVFGVVPADDVTLTFLALGTALLLWNLYRPSAFGLRASFVLSLTGAINYIVTGPDLDTIPFTWNNALAFALFLAQPALLRHWGREIVSQAESWVLVIVSSAFAWLFVNDAIIASQSGNLTLGWAFVALALIVIGFVANERRQRWCGLVVLVAALIRVGVHDFWLFSDGGKVLTFFALTVICLGLSFLYYKFADRLKEWL